MVGVEAVHLAVVGVDHQVLLAVDEVLGKVVLQAVADVEDCKKTTLVVSRVGEVFIWISYILIVP